VPTYPLGILVGLQRSLLLVEREGRSIRVVVYGDLRVLKDPLGIWEIRYKKWGV